MTCELRSKGTDEPAYEKLKKELSRSKELQFVQLKRVVGVIVFYFSIHAICTAEMLLPYSLDWLVPSGSNAFKWALC